MSESAFNILIGVDMSNAESEIKESIKKIGESYPLKLKAEITNEGELSNTVKNLIKLLSSFDINLGLGDEVKNLKQVQNIINNMDASEIGDDLAESMREAKKETDALRQSYEKMIKISEKFTEKKNTETTKKGNKFNNQTTVVSKGEEGDKTESVEFVRDFKALEEYQEKALKKIDSFKNVAFSHYGKDIEELVPRVANLMTLLQNGDSAFDNELRDVNQLIEKFDALEMQFREQAKAQDLQSKEAVKWAKKLAEVQREGYGNYQSRQKLARLINELTKDEARSLDTVKQKLKEIESQYDKINSQKADVKFGRRKTVEAEKLQKKVNKNVDESLVGSDEIARINNEIKKIFDADTVMKFENAVKRVIKQYEKLLEKQVQVLEQKKLEAQAEKEQRELQNRLKQMDDEKARLAHEEKERQYRINENTKKVDTRSSTMTQMKDSMVRTGLINASEFDLVESQIKEVGKLAKSEFADSFDVDKALKDVDKLLAEINSKYEMLHDRQRRMNVSVHDWKKEIQQIQSTGFVDASEFAEIEQKMRSLNVHSDTFEKELKDIENQMKKINSLANQRKTKQDDIEVKKYQNANKADDMSARGLLPQYLINDFKALNDMLDFKSSKQDIASVARELQVLAKLEEDIKKAGKEEAKIRSLIEQAQKELTKATDKYSDSLNEIVHNTNRQIKDAQRRNEVEQESVRIQQMINQFKERGNQLSYDEHRAIQAEIVALKRLAQAHRDVEAEDERRTRKEQQINDRFASNEYRAKRGFNKNSKELQEIQGLINNIKAQIDGLGDLAGDEFDKAVKRIEDDMTKLNRRQNELRDINREKSNSIMGIFQNAIKKVPIWVSAMTLVYGTMHQIQQGFQMLLEVDKAMINLQKVTEASQMQLEEFKQTASSMGKELGVMASEVIKATTEFQKLGYNLEQSAQLAENTLVYANVGDMGLDKAQEYIVSTIKGFGIEVDREGKNIRKIIDIFNEVGNNFAISSEGIGQALERSSAVLMEAGNTIEEAVALTVAANTTIQDPKKVGTALKTISMRLRGVNEEGEKVATLVPEIEKTLQRLNSQLGKTGNEQLSLLKENGKEFKSTYEIMEMISTVWDELTDIEQANLVEAIGGKHQGSVVASMIQNWKDAQGAIESANNSAGSAQREFNAYMDSFQYKIGQLKNALEEFWVVLMNDDAIKSLIEALTGLIEVFTKFTEIVGGGELMLSMIAFLGLFSNEKLRDAMLFGEALSMNFDKVKAGIVGILRIIPRFLGWFGLILGAVEVISLIIKGITAEKRAREEYIKTLDDEIAKLEKLQKNYDDLDKRFKNGATGGLDRYVELEDKGMARSLQEHNEYLKIQQYIKDEMPEMIEYVDEYGEAVLKSAEEIRGLREAQQELLTSKKREAFNLKLEDADFDDLQKQVDAIQEYKDIIEVAQKSLNIQDMVREFADTQLKGLDVRSEEYINKLQQLREKVAKEFENINVSSDMAKMNLNFDQNDVFMAINNYNPDQMIKQMDFLKNGINERLKNIGEGFEEAKKQVKTNMDDFSAMVGEQFTIALAEMKIDSKSNKFYLAKRLEEALLNPENMHLIEGDIKEIIGKIPQMINNAFAEIEGQGLTIDKLMVFDGNASKEQVESIVKDIETAIANLKSKGTSDALIVIQALEAIKNKHIEVYSQMNKPIVPHFSFAHDVFPVVDKYINQIRDLDSAYRQLEDGQSLSLSQTMELLAKYPQLTKYLESHNGVLQLSAKAIKELAKIKEEEFKADLRLKLQEAENAKKKADDVIQNILREAKAHQWLAEIKKKGAEQTIDELRRYQFMANKMGEHEIVAEIEEQIKNAEKIGEAMDAMANADSEIQNIQKLLNQNWTSQLGNITGGGNKQKKELQDAYYVSDQFKKKMDELNLAIAKQQALQKEYAKHSDGYRNALAEEIRLNNEKKKAIEAEIAALQKQVDSKNIEKKGLISITKDDNKTARAKQAELQQEIDQTIDKINQLKQEAISVGETITELKMQHLQASIDMFNNQREMLEDDIAYQEYAMGLYDEATEKYREHARVKFQLLKEQMAYHKQELALLEQEAFVNKNLTDQQINELYALIREKRATIYEMAKTIEEVQNAIINSHFEEKMFKYTSESEKYAKKIKEIEDKIKYDIDQEKDYSQHIKYLQEIISYRKGEIADIKATIAELKAMKERHKGNLEMTKKITEEIKAWEEKLYDAETAVKDVSQEIKDIYNNLADEYVEMYKEQLELMQRAEEEAYEDMMEAEQKRHEEKMKHIEKEMEILQDAHDKQMEMIDREERKRDYENDKSKLQDEINELKKQIDVLSLDDSYEAKAKKAQLVKELTEKEMELAEKEHDRQVELRKENLEDDLETEQEKLEKRKESYEEDYENWVEIQEQWKEKRDEYWEAELNNEKKFAELRKQVLEGNFDEMLETVESWSENVSEQMSYLGETVTENFTYKVKEAIEEIKKLQNMKIGNLDDLVNNTNPTDLDGDDMEQGEDPKNQEPNYSEITERELNIIRQMKANSDAWSKTTDPNERKRLAEENQRLGKQVKGAIYDNGYWYYKKKGVLLYDLLKGFKTGGYTGDWSGDEGKLAILHKKELVLNAEQTEHILSTAKIVEKLKNVIPNLNAISGLLKATPTPVAQTATAPIEQNEYNININIESMNGDRKSADIVADQIVNKIKRTKGGRF